MRWLNGITDSMDMNESKLQERVEVTGAWHAAVHGVGESWTQFGDQTTIISWYVCAVQGPRGCVQFGGVCVCA